MFDPVELVRIETAKLLHEIANDPSTVGPVLDIGPLTEENCGPTNLKHFVNARTLFTKKGFEYKTLDSEPYTNPDYCTDLNEVIGNVKPASFGTIICINVLEHIPEVHKVPANLQYLLKNNGVIYLLTPFNFFLHDPKPDCWRIGPDMYHILFKNGFKIEYLMGFSPDGNDVRHPVFIKAKIRQST